MRLESAAELALESSRSVAETPGSSERIPPAPSTTGPPCTDHSQSLPRRDNAQGTANRCVPLKRRRASPPPKSSGGKRPGRWEPPRPSQERCRSTTRTPRSLAPFPAIKARVAGLNPHGVVSKTRGPLPQQPARLPKAFREKRTGRSGCGPEALHREEGQESSWAPTSDPAVRDASRLSREERALALLEAARAPALVLSMVYQDGSTQLCPKQVSLAPYTSGGKLELIIGLDLFSAISPVIN